MRPLVVSHTGVAGGSNDAILLGLLRNAPPDVLPACVFLDDGPTVDAVRAMGFDGRVLRAGRARDVRRMASVIRALSRLIRALQRRRLRAREQGTGLCRLCCDDRSRAECLVPV